MPVCKYPDWESRPPRVDTSKYLRLVQWIARKRFADRPGLDMDERVSLGIQGLEKAARIFEPDRGVEFTTVATPWIWQAIRRGYELDGYIYRRSAAPARRIPRQHLSTLASNVDSTFDLEAPDTTLDVDEADRAAGLWARVDVLLTKREADYIRRWVGGKTLREISIDVGCSHETVRKIIRRSLVKLRGGLSRDECVG